MVLLLSETGRDAMEAVLLECGCRANEEGWLDEEGGDVGFRGDLLVVLEPPPNSGVGLRGEGEERSRASSCGVVGVARPDVGLLDESSGVGRWSEAYWPSEDGVLLDATLSVEPPRKGSKFGGEDEAITRKERGRGTYRRCFLLGTYEPERLCKRLSIDE